ncbi:MAG: polysaccharide deacetylase family protein [Gemmatimonadetes bacterium]|nr:polysaccharide deacetylase family protein [Gemmatimonadota bacterium]
MRALAYHQVQNRIDYSWNTVSPATLRRQMRMLFAAGIRGVPFGEVSWNDAAASDERTIAVTFDDAMSGAVRHAVPVLAEFGFRGTFFVPTEWVGRENRWDSRFSGRRASHATWDELRMARDHGWEIASHAHSHRDLTHLDESSLTRECEAPMEIIMRELGVSVRSLSYPFGRCDDRVARAARETGYEFAALSTSPDRAGSVPDPMRVGRVCVRRFDLAIEFRAKWGGGPLHGWQRAKDRIAYFCNAGTPAVWQRWSGIR